MNVKIYKNVRVNIIEKTEPKNISDLDFAKIYNRIKKNIKKNIIRLLFIYINIIFIIIKFLV